MKKKLGAGVTVVFVEAIWTKTEHTLAQTGKQQFLWMVNQKKRTEEILFGKRLTENCLIYNLQFSTEITNSFFTYDGFWSTFRWDITHKVVSGWVSKRLQVRWFWDSMEERSS